tara:strand:- start:151 stop:1356 length:1206 start_codon:yes stop_codon:yes gene_type:complete
MNNNSQQKEWTGVGKLTQLVNELERQKESRIDACIDTRQLLVGSNVNNTPRYNHGLVLQPVPQTQSSEFLPLEGTPFQTKALKQLGSRLTPNVPSKFLMELAEQHPHVGCDLLNQLMSAAPKRMLFRQLDGRVRAVLSDSYRCLDNYDLVFTALGVAQSVGANVLQCTMSDDKMRIKLIAPSMWETLNAGGGHANGMFKAGDLGNPEWREANGIGELGLEDTINDKGGNIVFPTCTISNSETGSGSTQVEYGTCDGGCFNMLTFDKKVRSVHLGSKLELGIFSEETVAADSKAIMCKMTDAIKACFDPAVFKKHIMLREGAQQDIIEAPTMAVDNVVKALDINETDRDRLLTYFVKDYAMTRDGLSQAVSRMAQDEFDNVDKSADFESMAGKLIEQPALIR